MKKVITIAMVIVLLTLFSICCFTLYSGSKQVNTANNVFDNTVELLKSRNFNEQAINTIISNQNEQSRFAITKKSTTHYVVKMTYTLKLFGSQKDKVIENDVHFIK